ncbi:hypothetical protein BH23PAT2_BH23PAT2_07670 [soil metagenome]
MSVSLREVIESGGYNLTTVEDAKWLMSNRVEFEELIEEAEELIEAEEAKHSRFDEEHYKNCDDCYSDHLDFMQEQEMDARIDAMAEEHTE